MASMLKLLNWIQAGRESDWRMRLRTSGAMTPVVEPTNIASVAVICLLAASQPVASAVTV